MVPLRSFRVLEARGSYFFSRSLLLFDEISKKSIQLQVTSCNLLLEMFSATKLAANRIGSKIASQLSRQQRLVPRETRVACYKIDRAFLSTPSLDDDDDDFTPQSPAEITLEIAEGIADTTQFYMRHGLSRQRLEFLAKTEQPVLHKWQKMMEVFLSK